MVRTELREHVFKMLFQVEFNRPDEMPEHLRLYFESLEHATDRDQEYIRTKYEKVIPLIPEIDALINAKSTDWKTKRMNKVDLAILRLAVYEMKWDPDIPTGVAINEAVELAKRFSGEESPAFVNGVLGRLAGRQDEPVSRNRKQNQNRNQSRKRNRNRNQNQKQNWNRNQSRKRNRNRNQNQKQNRNRNQRWNRNRKQNYSRK